MGTIKIKRGEKSRLPKRAPLGEPLYCTDTNELYIGRGDEFDLVLISDMSRFEVNVKDYKFSSEVSWDNAFRRAFDCNPGVTVRVDDGDYLITKPIEVNRDNNIKLSSQARIYTETEMECLVRFNTYREVNNIGDLSRDRFIEGGILDGNGKSEVVLGLSNYLHFTLSGVKIKNAKGIGIKTREFGNLSAELIVSNVHMQNDMYLPNSVGILNNSSDNQFSDVIIIDFPVAFKNTAFVILSRIHPWLSRSELVPNSVGFDLQGIVIMDGGYADTFQYNYKVSNGCTFKLSNSVCFNNPSVYTGELLDNNPCYVFYDESLNCNIRSKNFTLINDLSRISFINDLSQDRYYFESTSVINRDESCVVTNLQDREYLNAPGKKILDILDIIGLSLSYNSTLKGYLETGVDYVGISNSKSDKHLKLRDDGSVLVNDDNLLVVRQNPPSKPFIGQYYFNRDLGIPLFWNGVGWVKSDGMLPS